MTRWSVIAVVLVLGAAAWAADEVIVDAAGEAGLCAPRDVDRSTLELKWDNGDPQWYIAWYTGAGAWVGNDFNAATLKTRYVKILKFKFYSTPDWPNADWDGFRVGVFAFAGGVPGSQLWPPAGEERFFKPGRGDPGWTECPVDWLCPAVRFVAAEQQYYNWPDCDPFSVDTNPTFKKHSWEYYGGKWALLTTIGDPYRNLMVRVRVESPRTYPGVAPSSIGRVKALYY